VRETAFDRIESFDAAAGGEVELARRLIKGNDGLPATRLALCDDAPVRDRNGSETFTQSGRFPCQRRTTFGPFLKQPRFLRNAIALGAAPLASQPPAKQSGSRRKGQRKG